MGNRWTSTELFGLAGMSGLIGAQMAMGREHEPSLGWVLLGLLFMLMFLAGGDRPGRTR